MGKRAEVQLTSEQMRKGAFPVSLGRHIAASEPAPAVYLCQHAVRSKLTGRRGAAEVEGGFVAWVKAG